MHKPEDFLMMSCAVALFHERLQNGSKDLSGELHFIYMCIYICIYTQISCTSLLAHPMIPELLLPMRSDPSVCQDRGRKAFHFPGIIIVYLIICHPQGMSLITTNSFWTHSPFGAQPSVISYHHVPWGTSLLLPQDLQ